MSKIIVFAVLIFMILIGNASSQSNSEKKYYGIISGYIEYIKPALKNEKFSFYFEEYGNYVSRFDDITYNNAKRDDFSFTFSFTPESGYIYYSSDLEGYQLKAIEYPFVFGFDKELESNYKNIGKESVLWNENYRYYNNDRILLRNMRGFLRILGGNDEAKLEQSMKDRGFSRKGFSKILDRECICWDNSQKKYETTTEISTWKGIVLQWKEITEGKDGYLLVASTIKEEIAIPFVKFETPSGIKWKEWPKILK